MKKRLFLGLLLICIPLLFTLSWFLSERTFSLALQQEKTRTQMTESLMIQEFRESMSKLSFSEAAALARQYRTFYQAQGVELLFCWNGVPLGDIEMPERYQVLMGQGRASLLDTLGSVPRYLVAEPITHTLTLVFSRDVSDLYRLRSTLRLTCFSAAFCASLLLSVLGYLLAHSLTQPLSALTMAASQLANGASSSVLALPRDRRDEIGTLAKAFGEMADAVHRREQDLEAQRDARQEMLDAMSHEMRTPLTVLLGNLRLLGRPIAQADRERALLAMDTEIRRLTGLEEALMRLTHLSHDAPEMTAVDLLPLLRTCADRFKARHPVEVLGTHCRIQGDPALLALLGDNLISNAIQSGARAPVTVTVFNDGFTVRDSGIGMTEEQIRRSCEPFYRADKARTRAHGGAGLGLSLCQRVAEVHEGRLTFISRPGEGTAVTFSVPQAFFED